MISGAVGPGDHEHDTSSIWLVSILGGEPRRLRGDAYRAMLSPDDSLVAYRTEGGIWLADADGENPREFVKEADWEEIGSPRWSPDGTRVLYRRLAPTDDGQVATIESRGLDEESSVVLVREENPRDKPGLIGAGDFIVLGDRLVYAKREAPPRAREENLWEIRLDPRSGEPDGEARRLTDWSGFRLYDLSATADGSRLALLNGGPQADVYVGELGERAGLARTRRLTLDERDDIPTGWTPDGLGVVFVSDRHGSLDVLTQRLDARDARDLVRGEDDQAWPTLTPGGSSFLYWESEEGKGGPGIPRRLRRVPVDGGPTELVLETRSLPSVFCATRPDGPCLLIEARRKEAVATVSRLDPEEGRGEELWRVDLDPTVSPAFSLAPDGTQLAVVGHPEKARSIRLRDALTGEIVREIEVDGLPGATFAEVAWAPDGSGFYLIGDSPREMLLVRVDLQGEAQVLYEEPTGFLITVRPSPDGRHLAFGKVILESNAWMIEEF